MSLALKLAELRRKSGESLQQVADAVGVTKTHIWQLERGRSTNPSIALVTALANHFDVKVEWLLSEGSKPSEKDQRMARLHRLAKGLTERDQQVLIQMAETLASTRAAGKSR